MKILFESCFEWLRGIWMASSEGILRYLEPWNFSLSTLFSLLFFSGKAIDFKVLITILKIALITPFVFPLVTHNDFQWKISCSQYGYSVGAKFFFCFWRLITLYFASMSRMLATICIQLYICSFIRGIFRPFICPSVYPSTSKKCQIVISCPASLSLTIL